MPADYQVIHIREFVRSDVNGVISLELSRRVLRELTSAATAIGTTRLLIDMRETQPGMSIADAVELARDLGSLGLTANTRVAILMPEERERLQRGLYMQALASGQGYQIRPHLSFEAAVEWLNAAATD